jgi:hypothetical protein
MGCGASKSQPAGEEVTPLRVENRSSDKGQNSRASAGGSPQKSNGKASTVEYVPDENELTDHSSPSRTGGQLSQSQRLSNEAGQTDVPHHPSPAIGSFSHESGVSQSGMDHSGNTHLSNTAPRGRLRRPFVFDNSKFREANNSQQSLMHRRGGSGARGFESGPVLAQEDESIIQEILADS